MMRLLLALWLALLAPAGALAALPVLQAEKAPVAQAAPGTYAYVLTVRNAGQEALHRIFVEETCAMGELQLPTGAFVSFSGTDVLLNQNGTATILRLDPGQEVRLCYEAQLPQGFTAERVQTHCAVSALYETAQGESYVLIAAADEAVPMPTATPAPTAAPTPVPPAGALRITLAETSLRAAAGGTLRCAVTVTNAGPGPLTGLTLRLEELLFASGDAVAGAWTETAGWAPGEAATLRLDTLAPGVQVQAACVWTLPQGAEASGTGAVSGYALCADGSRQDACAAFQVNAPGGFWRDMGESLPPGDWALLGATALLCLWMALRFRPGRFAPGRPGAWRPPGA